MLFYKANIHWKSEEQQLPGSSLQTLEQNQCQRLE